MIVMFKFDADQLIFVLFLAIAILGVIVYRFFYFF